jgi:DNA-binding response OmpR family regulator
MKKRILVVENDKHILELISIILDDAGYEACLYLNENKIFEHITQFQPDAIILDILRPTLKGTELCRQLKEARSTTHIPIIALSTDAKIQKVKGICADEVIEKPFDIDLLINILNKRL